MSSRMGVSVIFVVYVSRVGKINLRKTGTFRKPWVYMFEIDIDIDR